MASVDTAFTGSVAQFYERFMVPLIFEPYALDLAKRVARAAPARVLEIAAGTGALTRQLSAMLDGQARLTATDLNPAMIEEAARIGTPGPVRWLQADAMQLPFEPGSFDAVACQFGAMFFPDRPHAYAQALRVLRPGGLFAFNVWGPIAANEFADVVTRALAGLYPQDPPRFLARTPHGYNDSARIAQDLASAGFVGAPEIETLAFASRAASAALVAQAYCEGTPLRGEIEARDPGGLGRATAAAAQALRHSFGDAQVEGRIEALVVCVASPPR